MYQVCLLYKMDQQQNPVIMPRHKKLSEFYCQNIKLNTDHADLCFDRPVITGHTDTNE